MEIKDMKHFLLFVMIVSFSSISAFANPQQKLEALEKTVFNRWITPRMLG
jgi:hypothetical protein